MYRKTSALEAVREIAFNTFTLERQNATLGFKRTTELHPRTTYTQSPWISRSDGSQVSLHKIFDEPQQQATGYELRVRSEPGASDEEVVAFAGNEGTEIIIISPDFNEESMQTEFQRVSTEVEARHQASYQALGAATLRTAIA